MLDPAGERAGSQRAVVVAVRDRLEVRWRQRTIMGVRFLMGSHARHRLEFVDDEWEKFLVGLIADYGHVRYGGVDVALVGHGRHTLGRRATRHAKDRRTCDGAPTVKAGHRVPCGEASRRAGCGKSVRPVR